MRRSVARSAVFCAVLVLSALSGRAASTDPQGHWEGAIELPGTRLAVDVDLAVKDGKATGDISIPQQGAKDLALVDVAVDGAKVSFAIGGIPGTPTFRGTIDAAGTRLAGEFTQGGRTYPFALERKADPLATAGQRLEGLDAWVEKTLADFEAPGLGLAVVKDGQVLLAKGYGLRDVAQKQPAGPDTLFAIGSSTKAFTTLLLGLLVDDGKLDWDRPVIEFMPEFRLLDPVLTEKMTPRDLVTHRSGLPRHDLLWYNNVSLSRADAVRRLRWLEANRGHREQFQYNNLMYMTAGYLVERLSGKSWEDNVRTRIFAPLGMTGARVTLEEALQAKDLAAPYEKRDDKVVAVPHRGTGLCMGPAGSIYASARDMARWAQLQLGTGTVDGKPLVQPTTLADMHVPHMAIARPANPQRPEVGPAAYGLGWFVDSYRGHQRVHHGGNIDGFSALVTLFPQDGVGVVALVNRGASPVPDLVVREVFDRLAALEPRNWASEALAAYKRGEALEKEAGVQKQTVRRPGTKPAHPVEEYAGAYEHAGYGVLTVEAVKGKLVGRYNDLPLPLEHWHYETFNVAKDPVEPTAEGMKLTFRTDEDGDVTEVSAVLESNVKPIVFTRKADARLSDPAFLAKLAGQYEIAGQVVTVALRAGTLTVSSPGSPTVELVPGRGTTFQVKGISGFSIRFVLTDKGEAKELQLNQPGGLLTATRKS